MTAENPDGKDYVETKFPRGPGIIRWHLVCRDCGRGAGGFFSKAFEPDPEVVPHAVCPGCLGGNLALTREAVLGVWDDPRKEY